ncbi:hypothetical protein, partial [Alkalilimnicola ehrlichii]
THLAGALEYLPRDWRPTATTLLFADYDQRKGRFAAYTIEVGTSAVSNEVELDLSGKRVHCFGSGAQEAENKIGAVGGEDQQWLTTASIIGVLADVINGKEGGVGGPPQMVMLTKDRQKLVGFCWPTEKDRRYLFGLPIELSGEMNSVTWKNKKFVTCRHQTIQRFHGS